MGGAQDQPNAQTQQPRNAMSMVDRGLAAFYPEAYQEGQQIAQQRQAQEAARRAAELEQQRMGSQARVYAERFGVGQRQPMTGAPAPITPQAPMQQQPARIGADGMAIPQEQVTVMGGRGLPRMRQPDPQEIDQALFMDAIERGDVEQQIEFGRKLVSSLDEGSKAQIMQLGAVASQLNALDDAQLIPAAKQTLDQMIESGMIDPDSVNIDEIIATGDVNRVRVELRMLQGIASPQDAVKEGIRVQGTRDEFRRPEVADLGGRRAVIGMSGNNAGQEIASFDVSADPNAVLGAQTQRFTAGVSAETQRRWQDIQAAIAAANRASQQRIAVINANARMSEGEKNRAVQRERTRAAREIAVLTGKIELGDEVGADEFAD